MMKFYPYEQETRLVRHSQEQLQEVLKKYVQPIKKKPDAEKVKDFLFNGLWYSETFSISLKLKTPNNFIPIIHGSCINSDEGTLIQLTYQMFPATKRLLMFWTVLTVLITLFFIVLYQAWMYGAISFGFCLVNFILSRENFKTQLNKSKRMLDKMLS